MVLKSEFKSSQMEAITTGAVRQPSYPFGSPVLISNFIIWNDKDIDPVYIEDDGGITEYNRRIWELIYEKINKFADRMLESSALPQENFKGFHLDRVSDFFRLKKDSLKFTLWWDTKLDETPIPVDVHIEWYQDFFQISFYIDVLGYTDPVDGKRKYYDHNTLAEQTRRYAIEQHIQGVNNSAFQLYSNKNQNLSNRQENENSQSATYLYEKVWLDFYKEFGLISDPATSNLDFTAGWGKIYGHFCALAFTIHQELWKPLRDELPLNSAEAATPSVEKSEMAKITDAYIPFISKVTNREPDIYEHLAMGVLESHLQEKGASARAIYVSALGPKGESPSQEDEENQINTIRYVLLLGGPADGKVYKPQFQHQLGRLIFRINKLGALRLAALRDSPVLKVASSQIRIQGKELSSLLQRWNLISNKYDKEEQHEEIKREDIPEINKDHEISDIKDKLLKKTRQLAEIGKHARGGFSYRVSRSRRYIQTFNDLNESLRPVPIDGYVSYNEFIKRRLRTDFDDILSLGDRMLKLRNRFEAALQIIQTQELVDSNKRTAQNTNENLKLQKATQRTTWAVGSLAILGLAETSSHILKLLNKMGFPTCSMTTDESHSVQLDMGITMCLTEDKIIGTFWILALVLVLYVAISYMYSSEK